MLNILVVRFFSGFRKKDMAKIAQNAFQSISELLPWTQVCQLQYLPLLEPSQLGILIPQPFKTNQYKSWTIVIDHKPITICLILKVITSVYAISIFGLFHFVYNRPLEMFSLYWLLTSIPFIQKFIDHNRWKIFQWTSSSFISSPGGRQQGCTLEQCPQNGYHGTEEVGYWSHFRFFPLKIEMQFMNLLKICFVREFGPIVVKIYFIHTVHGLRDPQ